MVLLSDPQHTERKCSCTHTRTRPGRGTCQLGEKEEEDAFLCLERGDEHRNLSIRALRGMIRTVRMTR